MLLKAEIKVGKLGKKPLITKLQRHKAIIFKTMWYGIEISTLADGIGKRAQKLTFMKN